MRFIKHIDKKIRGGLHLIEGYFFGHYKPIELNIHITDRCNLKCTYCYNNFYKRNVRDIPRDDIFRIVDAFKKLGILEVSLVGGEPFLHPDFPAIVEYIKSKNILCSSVTNGYFIRRHLETAKKLDMVCVSIDGPEEVNDIVRGKGSYQKALEALEILRTHHINRGIRVTLHKYNLSSLEEIVGLAKRFDAIIFLSLLFAQSSDDFTCKIVSRAAPDDTELRGALIKVATLKKKYPRIFLNSLANVNYAIQWPTRYSRFFLLKSELKEFPSFKPIPCFCGRAYATIDTDGKLYPCPNRIGHCVALNILEMDVLKAWRGLKNHNCAACFYLSANEKNLLSNMNIDALWNVFTAKRLR